MSPPARDRRRQCPRQCVLTALLLLIVAAASRTDAAPLNLLFYGNSFTNGAGGNRAVPFLVRAIAAAAGQPTPNVEHAAVPGVMMGYHRTGNTAVIADPLDFVETPWFQWDAVVLQGFSTEATHIGNVAQFRADTVGVYNNVRAHSPNVRPILFQTWARSPGHDLYPATFANASAMQAEVRAGYVLARADLATAAVGHCLPPPPPLIAGVGDAFERANWANLYDADLYHANSRGSLLAALTIYRTLYDDDTADINLTPVLQTLGLTQSDAAQLTGIVDRTTVNPEPGTMSLVVVGGAAVLLRRRRVA